MAPIWRHVSDFDWAGMSTASTEKSEKMVYKSLDDLRVGVEEGMSGTE